MPLYMQHINLDHIATEKPTKIEEIQELNERGERWSSKTA